MASFSTLPYTIKENIFSRIRYRDLYEASVVSEEWFWLTIETFKGILREEDQFIKSLLNFYNREKQLSTPLMWFDLVKYGNVDRVELEYSSCPLVLNNFLESRKPIRSLCLRTEYKSSHEASLSLESVFKYFPHLQKLKVNGFAVDTGLQKIPKGITEVHLLRIKVNSVPWSSLFDDPQSIQSMRLEVYRGLTFDHCMFKNLKSLSLYLYERLPDHQMKNILDFIRGHKLLTSVNLAGAKITKEWFNLFGKTIQIISLEYIIIEKQLLSELGNDGCYERRVMSFVCSNFSTVKRFHLAYMSTDSVNVLEENEERTDIDYRGAYTCRPQVMEEELFLELSSRLSRPVQAITTTDDGPALRVLHIEGINFRAELLTNCVPASVKKFEISLDGQYENLSISRLCEQPENLEEMSFYSPGVTNSLSIQQDCFMFCTQLKILEMTHVNRDGIQNLLQHCVSLQELTLIKPEKGCFTDLSPTVVSKTIREVNLYSSDARLEDVLCHCPNLEVLELSSHEFGSLSMPTGIAKLKTFSATFEGSRYSGDSKNFALVMDTFDLPFKLFYSDKWSSTFILAQSDSFIKEFCRRGGHAYCQGFPTRFLEVCGIKILADVQHFTIEIASGT